MKTVIKVLLMEIAYLALFLIGASSGLIHPACYAYIGAILPLIFAFIYLYTSTIIRGFGVATALNGFVLIVGLIMGESDPSIIIGLIGLTILSEILMLCLKKERQKAVRWSFIPFAFSFFAYVAHWWTDKEGSLAAAAEEMPAGYDELMRPVIENIPMLIVVLILTIPISIIAMRIAERVLKAKKD